MEETTYEEYYVAEPVEETENEEMAFKSLCELSKDTIANALQSLILCVRMGLVWLTFCVDKLFDFTKKLSGK